MSESTTPADDAFRSWMKRAAHLNERGTFVVISDITREYLSRDQAEAFSCHVADLAAQIPVTFRGRGKVLGIAGAGLGPGSGIFRLPDAILIRDDSGEVVEISASPEMLERLRAMFAEGDEVEYRATARLVVDEASGEKQGFRRDVEIKTGKGEPVTGQVRDVAVRPG
jgi:hypothetical protein